MFLTAPHHGYCIAIHNTFAATVWKLHGAMHRKKNDSLSIFFHLYVFHCSIPNRFWIQRSLIGRLNGFYLAIICNVRDIIRQASLSFVMFSWQENKILRGLHLRTTPSKLCLHANLTVLRLVKKVSQELTKIKLNNACVFYPIIEIRELKKTTSTTIVLHIQNCL